MFSTIASFHCCTWAARRHVSVDVQLEHASISRHHALLCFKAGSGTVCVMDLGSAHGTYVAGKRCQRVRALAPMLEDFMYLCVNYVSWTTLSWVFCKCAVLQGSAHAARV